jgi:hypothetical protein
MIKEMLLSLPKNLQKEILADAYRKSFGLFVGFAKVLLDAPISEGGMSTKEVEEIRKAGFQEKLYASDRIVCSNGFSTMK